MTTPCFRYNLAIVRNPAPSVVHGLRAENQDDPDYGGVCMEHMAYVMALERAGLEVTVLPPLVNFPDSIFVEDPALVFSEGAILLRPGAPTRQGEVQAIAPTLRSFFQTILELPPGTHADGGDVLVTPDSIFIGLSARTDKKGAMALSTCLEQLGYGSTIVNTPSEVLHLKSDCSLLDEETVLLSERLKRAGIFSGFRQIALPPGENGDANAIRINDVVLVSSSYPQTQDMLVDLGYRVVPLETTEIEKIDAGLSCMSLRWLQ